MKALPQGELASKTRRMSVSCAERCTMLSALLLPAAAPVNSPAVVVVCTTESYPSLPAQKNLLHVDCLSACRFECLKEVSAAGLKWDFDTALRAIIERGHCAADVRRWADDLEAIVVERDDMLTQLLGAKWELRTVCGGMFAVMNETTLDNFDTLNAAPQRRTRARRLDLAAQGLTELSGDALWKRALADELLAAGMDLDVGELDQCVADDEMTYGDFRLTLRGFVKPQPKQQQGSRLELRRGCTITSWRAREAPGHLFREIYGCGCGEFSRVMCIRYA